jgi:hypothetical protein
MGRSKIPYLFLCVLVLCLAFAAAFPTAAEVSGDYTYETNNGQATITQYNGTETDVVIPSALDGFPVTGIDNSAFSNKEAVAKITIPDGVTRIGEWAFEGTGIASIDLPESLAWIGDMAFFDCKSLQAIAIPETNGAYVSLDGVLYSRDMNMTKLIAYPAGRAADSYQIPSGVKIIAGGAFAHSSLTKIIIPEGVERIGINAFNSCMGLKRLDLPASLKSDGLTLGFYVCIGGCEALEGIHVSKDNASYASLDGVLYNKSMTELLAYPLGKANDSFTVPAGVISISLRAFEQNTHIKSVTLPEGMEVIGDDAFSDCHNLKEIVLPDSLTSIGSASFWLCEKLKDVILPKGLTSIGSSAFYACMELERVIIPPLVTTINIGTFASCKGLASIKIPPSVTGIGETAFYDCKDITITGEPGSCAQDYARENNIPFIISVQTGASVQSGQEVFAVTGAEFKENWISKVGYRYLEVQLDLQYEGDEQDPPDMFGRLMVVDSVGRLFDLSSFGSSLREGSVEWERRAGFVVPKDTGALRLVVLDPDQLAVAGLLDVPVTADPPAALPDDEIATFTGKGVTAVVHSVTQSRYSTMYQQPGPGWKYVYLDMTFTWSGSTRTVSEFMSQFRYLQAGWKEWRMQPSYSGLHVLLNDELPFVRTRVQFNVPENDTEVILSFNGAAQTLAIQGEEFYPGSVPFPDIDGYYPQAEWKVKVNGIHQDDKGDLPALPKGSHYMIADITVKNRSVLNSTFPKEMPFSLTDEDGHDLAQAWLTNSDRTLDTVLTPDQSITGEVAFVLPVGVTPEYLRVYLSTLDAPILILVSKYLTE